MFFIIYILHSTVLKKGIQCFYIYIYIYIYIPLIEGKILHVIERKNNQHFNNISATAFINSCQHLQFIYSAQNHLNPKDHYRYQETRYYLQ